MIFLLVKWQGSNIVTMATLQLILLLGLNTAKLANKPASNQPNINSGQKTYSCNIFAATFWCLSQIFPNSSSEDFMDYRPQWPGYLVLEHCWGSISSSYACLTVHFSELPSNFIDMLHNATTCPSTYWWIAANWCITWNIEKKNMWFDILSNNDNYHLQQ